MTSGLSFSTHRNASQTSSYIPTVYSLSSAKRRIYQFIDAEISKAHQRDSTISLSPGDQEDSFGIASLPSEIIQQAMKFLRPNGLLAIGTTCKALYSASCSPQYWRRHIAAIVSSLQLSNTHLAPSNLPNARKICLALYKFSPHLEEAVKLLLQMTEEAEHPTSSSSSLSRSGEIGREEGEKKCSSCAFKRKERLEEIFNRLGMDGPWYVSKRERVERDLSTFWEKPESSKVDLSWSFLSDNCLRLHMFVKEGFYSGLLSFHVHFNENTSQPPTIHSLSPDLYHPFILSTGEVSQAKWLVSGRGLISSLVDLFIDPHYLTSYFEL